MDVVLSKHIGENMRSLEDHLELIQGRNWLSVAGDGDLPHLVKGARLKYGQLVTTVRAVEKPVLRVER